MPDCRLLLIAGLLLAAPLAGQAPAPVADAEGVAPAASPRRYASPWKAFEAGAWDQALEGFVDRQVANPGDPALAFNVGDAHYKMRNWAEARRAFSEAALSGDLDLRADALYNLGNVAYREGRLDEAVERYKASLEIDPDDEDAKFNLEFVRDEIRRRHEEAQKRQQQQDQQQQEQPQEQQPQGEEPSDPGEQGEQQPGEGAEEPQPGAEEGEQEAQGAPESGPGGPDADRDGLPDRVEREGENPTDPENPDTDGDGLPDGAEDIDRDGRVDPGETDPNLVDTDGDGVPDGREDAAPGEATAEPAPEGLTPEEAARYLAALEEGRPDQKRGRPGRRTRPEKDW